MVKRWLEIYYMAQYNKFNWPKKNSCILRFILKSIKFNKYQHLFYLIILIKLILSFILKWKFSKIKLKLQKFKIPNHLSYY
jgi:hypothetical protein